MSRARRIVINLWSHVTRRFIWPGRKQKTVAFPVPVTVPGTHPKCLAYLLGNPIFSIPIERCRYSDGRRYSYGEHHFLQYYRNGFETFHTFYQTHQPGNIFERYFLSAPREISPCIGNNPWFAYYERKPPSREAGLLDSVHGCQICGPASEERIASEARRLDHVLASIRQHGFRPEMGGHVRGYFMLRLDGQWVFVIREGFHRVAALAHLGHTNIDARIHPYYPRFVEEADSQFWPMVQTGVLTQSEAIRIFAQFFKAERDLQIFGTP
jgi:hypothetical protein